MKKKYNLLTAISMVVGIIIGSGIFFKTGTILEATGGSLLKGILAFLVGGLVMLSSSYTFSIFASNSNVDGSVVDFMEEACGKKAGYYLGFYVTTIYYPCMAAVVSWCSAKYALILFGMDALKASNHPFTIILSVLFLLALFLINHFAPKIAGKLQVSTTIIKLIPLIFIAIVGTLYGLISSHGVLLENFRTSITQTGPLGLFKAICATAFAYEGWICVTSINKELNDSKKNLPKALIFGSFIVIGIYLLYYIGLAGVFSNEEFMKDTDATVKKTFQVLVGSVGGTLLFVFLVISCLGTLNGLTMANSRSSYQLASKSEGILSKKICALNSNGMSFYSGLIGFILALFWLVIWMLNFYQIYPQNAFIDISELCIILLYLAYIPIYIQMIRKNKEFSLFKRFIAPILAIISALFIVGAAIYVHHIYTLIFIIIIVIDLLIAYFISILNRQRKVKNSSPF